MPRSKGKPLRAATLALRAGPELGLPAVFEPGTRLWIADDAPSKAGRVAVRLRAGRQGVAYQLPEVYVDIDAETGHERRRRVDAEQKRRRLADPEYRSRRQARERARHRTPEARAKARARRWKKKREEGQATNGGPPPTPAPPPKPKTVAEFLAQGGQIRYLKAEDKRKPENQTFVKLRSRVTGPQLDFMSGNRGRD